MLADMEVLRVRRRVSHCCTFTRIVAIRPAIFNGGRPRGTQFCLHCFPQQK